MKRFLLLILISFSFFYSEAQDYVLYGMTKNGGAYGEGNIIKYNPADRRLDTLSDFNGMNGAYPQYSNNLTIDTANGLLYGMTVVGGLYNYGLIFNYSQCTGLETPIVNFKYNENPYNVRSDLIFDPVNGLYYGTSYAGGMYDSGAIFSFNPTNNGTNIVVSLNKTTGYFTQCSLTLNPIDGKLYGMTTCGGTNGVGVIFRYDPTTNSENILFSFNNINGEYPRGALTYNLSDSLFYGMTYQGGDSSVGVLFSFNSITNMQTVLVDFNETNGANPGSNLIFDRNNGIYYGMTEKGGDSGAGVIFEFNPSTNSDSVLFNFNGHTQGANPYGDLTLDPINGLYYGMTLLGGTGYGAIFSFNPITDIENPLFSFNGASNGSQPWGSLTYDSINGLFYGMTNKGGSTGWGGILSFNPTTNSESMVISFSGGTTAGYPFRDLTFNPSQNLFYGMTLEGGVTGGGVILNFNPLTNTFNDVYSFGGYNSEESNPYGSLTYSPVNNYLYGMTFGGGIYTDGTIFSFNPVNGSDSVIGSFNWNHTGDGARPTGSFTLDPANDYLYGMTVDGDASYGTIFYTNPRVDTGSYIFYFNNTDGNLPYGDLTYDSINGLFYGMTRCGGTTNQGVLFSIDPVTHNEATLVNFNQTNGANPYGDLTLDPINGLFYGMTHGGGSSAYGDIISFNPTTNTESVVFTFNNTNGSYPFGSLTFDPDSGFFYGMTSQGGTYNDGVLFNFDPLTNSQTILVQFNGQNGKYPYGSLTLINPNDMKLVLTGNTLLCSPNSIILSTNAGSNANYIWSNGATTSTIDVSPVITTTYSLAVCKGVYSKDTSITVTVSPAVSAIIGSFSNITCNGGNNGNATIIASGGVGPFTYLWSNGATISAVSGLIAGTYSVTVSDSIGCTASANLIISQPTAIVPTITEYSSIKCHGDSDAIIFANATGGTGFYEYQWSDASSQTNAIATGLSAGTYTITVTDNDGCSGTANATLIQPPALSITADSINATAGNCNGSAWALISGGTTPYSYFWTGGLTTDTITNQCAGYYCSTITDANGCVDSACTTIEISTGVNEVNGGSENVKVYPNPNNGVFTIAFSHSELVSESQTIIEVYNVLGEQVYYGMLNPPAGGQGDNTIDLSSQPNGVYFYRVLRENGGLIGEGKVIIEK